MFCLWFGYTVYLGLWLPEYCVCVCVCACAPAPHLFVCNNIVLQKLLKYLFLMKLSSFIASSCSQPTKTVIVSSVLVIVYTDLHVVIKINKSSQSIITRRMQALWGEPEQAATDVLCFPSKCWATLLASIAWRVCWLSCQPCTFPCVWPALLPSVLPFLSL